MRKKSVIFGLVLLLAGTAALRWVLAERRKERQQVAYYKLKYGSELDEYLKQYNEWLQLAPEERAGLPWGPNKDEKTKTEAHLRQEQQERLKADMDKLAAGETDIPPGYAPLFYGENWQQQLDEYKTQKEKSELALTASTVCMLTGGTIVTWWLLLWTARLLIKGSSHLVKLFDNVFRPREQARDKQPIKNRTKEDQKTSEQEQKPHEQQSRLKKHSKLLVDSGWQSFNKNLSNQHEQAQPQADLLVRNETQPNRRDTKSVPLGTHSSKNADAIRSESAAHNSSLSVETANEVKPEDSLKTQTENLEKQVAEFKQMAGLPFCSTSQKGHAPQYAQQAALVHSEPINNTLKELAQQVSAIREYASHQQNRVNKLQDGYDWNIIRIFCLRVIRCIDNLENRIEQLSRDKIDTTDLKEVRDELVFALESSGVEQFEPEIDGDYRGQEKTAEAVKDRQCCNDPNLTGKIAKVIRPGYQYFIDEENIKIVRTAQVKLYK